MRISDWSSDVCSSHRNDYVDRPVHFSYFFARKVMFVRYAAAFVAFPGGFGTIDELFEALTLIQTEKIPSFPVVLVGSDNWSGLFDWLRVRLRRSEERSVGQEGVSTCKARVVPV